MSWLIFQPKLVDISSFHIHICIYKVRGALPSRASRPTHPRKFWKKKINYYLKQKETVTEIKKKLFNKKETVTEIKKKLFNKKETATEITKQLPMPQPILAQCV